MNLYEVSPHTFGGITSLEIAHDHFQQHEMIVIYFSDGDPNEDKLPAYSDEGYPLFVPKGIDKEKVLQAHYKEFMKNANHMRRFVVDYANRYRNLKVVMDRDPRPRDVKITPRAMHAVDLFRAVAKAASGKRVTVNFMGGKSARDADGHPRIVAPESPSAGEMRALLDHYVAEGSELRQEIARLVEISVFVRVVFTQRAAMDALAELLKIGGILK